MFITKLHVHTPSQMKPLADWFVYFGWFEFFTSNKKLTMSHQRLSKVKAKNMHPIGLDLVISVCQSNTLHSRPQPFRHCLSLFFASNWIRSGYFCLSVQHFTLPPPAIQTLLKSETINCFLPNEFNCSGMKIWELKWAFMIPKGWEHAFSLWVASYGLRDAVDTFFWASDDILFWAN